MQIFDFSISRALAAQLLALVVQQLFPNVLLAGGGASSVGFYYDFVFESDLAEGMVEWIEMHLRTLIKADKTIKMISMMRENAATLYMHHSQPLLAQQAQNYATNIIELVQIDQFYGICTHFLPTTAGVGHVKLWNALPLPEKIITPGTHYLRLTGTVQSDAKTLKSFLKAFDVYHKKQDHRILGPQLNLFEFDEKLQGMDVIWLPAGIWLRQHLIKLAEKHAPENAKQIETPLMVASEIKPVKIGDLLHVHVTDQDQVKKYRLRSSCWRQHIQLLNSNIAEHLPYQIMEYGHVYVNRKEVELLGLLNNISHITDTTTICCSKAQLFSQLISSLHFIEKIVKILQFEAQWYLVLPFNKLERTKQVMVAADELKRVIQAEGRHYNFDLHNVQESEMVLHATLELRIIDALGREWPASTLSLIRDKTTAERLPFEVFIRQLWGSLDRFIALVVEHYEGHFPLWLTYEQIRVINIGEANRAYAEGIVDCLQQQGLRAHIDFVSDKLGTRIHAAEKARIPYIVMVGDRERLKRNICVREGSQPNRQHFYELEQFINILKQK